MEIRTHVHAPAFCGMPAVDFLVKTVGRESVYEAAGEIYLQMQKDAGVEPLSLPGGTDFVTDEQHVAACRTKVLELLAELEKYNAEIHLTETATKMDWSGFVQHWHVVMGAEKAIVFSQLELHDEDY